MKIKLIALFILIAMLMPVSMACGDEPANTGSGSGSGAEPAGQETTPEPTPAPTPAPTDPPPPTDPPTTEAPTEPFEVDSSLSYFDQIYSELEWRGLTGGVMAFNAANADNDGLPDEASLMKRFGLSNARREEMTPEQIGDGVPFTSAYTVRTSADQANFWEAGYSSAFARGLDTNQDDLVVGVVWIRGRRLEESEQFMEDEPADFYLAIKTPTDEWASEGEVQPQGRQSANEEEWERIMFTGRVINEETQSSNMGFNIYIGYGVQEFDIGGIVAWIFPSTTDNEKAAMRIHF